MSTGRSLEASVHSALEKAVRGGHFGLEPDSCCVFLNKAYFSRDRSRDIVFDVSIEVTPPGCSEPVLVWIWECKDYSRSVPVDDLEEFYAKLDQIGFGRTKGTMITTSRYQTSAIEYATSKGIGLTRLVGKEEIEIFYRPGYFLPEADDALCRRVLAEGNKEKIRWNRYVAPLPLHADSYFFSLTFRQRGLFNDSLHATVKTITSELRAELHLSIEASSGSGQQ